MCFQCCLPRVQGQGLPKMWHWVVWCSGIRRGTRLLHVGGRWWRQRRGVLVELCLGRDYRGRYNEGKVAWTTSWINGLYSGAKPYFHKADLIQPSKWSALVRFFGQKQTFGRPNRTFFRLIWQTYTYQVLELLLTLRSNLEMQCQAKLVYHPKNS
jgi:hypothetical protein